MKDIKNFIKENGSVIIFVCAICWTCYSCYSIGHIKGQNKILHEFNEHLSDDIEYLEKQNAAAKMQKKLLMKLDSLVNINHEN